jgi:hypothetical protein
VYLSPRAKRALWISCAALPFALPGWRGELVPVAHDEILADAARYDAGDVFGVSLPGDAEGEEWHAQFLGSRPALALDALALRKLAPRLVPPAYMAHIPPGTDALPSRADAYYRVIAHTRWPWWWPGGGVDLARTGS